MHKKFTKLGYNLISLPRLRVQMSVFCENFTLFSMCCCVIFKSILLSFVSDLVTSMMSFEMFN